MEELKLDSISQFKAQQRISKILYSAGFQRQSEQSIIDATFKFLTSLLSLVFNEAIIIRISLMKKNPKVEGKLIMSYFSYVWEEEFYVYSDRFNDEMYFKQKLSRKRMMKLKINKSILHKKIKKLKHLKASIRLKKHQKNEFFLARTSGIDGEELEYLEKCKEQTVFRANHQQIFKALQQLCKFDLNFLNNDPFILQFINYAITIEVKKLVEKTLKLMQNQNELSKVVE